MIHKGRRLKHIKGTVESIWENPASHKLENHYKFLRRILRSEYRSLDNLSDELLEDIAHVIVYSDRYLRKRRQGNENELKKSLEREFIKTL